MILIFRILLIQLTCERSRGTLRRRGLVFAKATCMATVNIVLIPIDFIYVLLSRVATAAASSILISYLGFIVAEMVA